MLPLGSEWQLRVRQSGFWRYRSKCDLLALVSYLWWATFDNHGKLQLVCVKISKSFHRIWHEGLLAKVPTFGFSQALASWASSFISKLIAIRPNQMVICYPKKPIQSTPLLIMPSHIRMLRSMRLRVSSALLSLLDRIPHRAIRSLNNPFVNINFLVIISLSNGRYSDYFLVRLWLSVFGICFVN